MARAPDARIGQAKAMYLQGKKLVEIASQLNLPEGTVRRWKSTHTVSYTHLPAQIKSGRERLCEG